MKDIAKLKSELKAGKSLRKSMLAAGYSQASANQGKRGMGKSVLRELLKSKINMGAELTAEERTKLIRGALVENIMDGNDKSVQSIKLLGADKELSLWQAENLTGIVVVQLPERKHEELPVIDVPLLNE